ncbi:MAG: heavy metal translocating P-type ATPase [Candidatus Berkiella sp.]
MANFKTLDFDISGMTCTSCSTRIENKLITLPCVQQATVNYATKRARVVVEDQTDPQHITGFINSIDPDVKKFTASYISPSNEKTYYFSILGMVDANDAKLIKEKLEQQKENLNSFSVNYSTGVAVVTAYSFGGKEQSEAIAINIKKVIESAVSDKKITATRFAPKTNEPTATIDGPVYRRRAIINALVGIPLFLLSGFIPPPITVAGQLIGFFLGGITLGLMYKTGKEFYRGAWDRLVKDRSSDMNTLIALGTGSAWIYSMLVVLVPGLFPLAALQYHFLAVNMILGIINFGKGIRANAEQQTKNKVQKLAQVYVNLQPQHARVIGKRKFKDNMLKKDNNNIVETHYLQIKKGDIVQILKDKRVPVEGVIISDSETMVDEETLTGEPGGSNKKKGDEVSSGSLNLKNTIYIRATRDGKDGHLTRVIADVNKSSGTKPPSISKLVDKLAVVFVPAITLIAGFSALGWYFLGPVPALPWMLKSGMSVLLCACPCALGLATPISTAIGMYNLFNKKILVHDASALEVAAHLNVVVIDKTGTVTHSVVHDVSVCEKNKEDWTNQKVIQYAASLERSFDHPIAQSFINQNFNHDFLHCTDQTKHEEGVLGIVNGANLHIGSLQHLQTHNVNIPASCKAEEERNEKNGMSSVYFAVNGECIAVVACKHQIRKDAKKLVDELKDRGIEVIMLTGDQKEPAKDVARKIGITKVVAKSSAKDKQLFIKDLIKQGLIVAMVGDGVNDVPAMKEADLAIAVGSWTHASSVAKVATQQLNFIPFLIMAKETMNNIHQNLYWTGFYNLLSLTAATGLLYYLFGFSLNPVVASLLMAFSSVSVVINSMRLTNKIDYAMGVYEGKIKPPANTFEKIMQYIPFRGLLDLLISTIIVKPAEDKTVPQSPVKGASMKLPAGRSTLPGYRHRSSPPGSPDKRKHDPILISDADLDNIVIKSEPGDEARGRVYST